VAFYAEVVAPVPVELDSRFEGVLGHIEVDRDTRGHITPSLIKAAARLLLQESRDRFAADSNLVAKFLEHVIAEAKQVNGKTLLNLSTKQLDIAVERAVRDQASRVELRLVTFAEIA